MNFEFGSSLADFQDEKFKQYKAGKSISSKEKRRLKYNLWVRMATKMAPGNLVVRHYCLMDLFSKRPRYKKKIQDQLDKLGNKIWREGYSYWLYTKYFLVEYDKKHKAFGTFVKEMDSNFQDTAYKAKDGKLYPAPYGDLRHIPLEKQGTIPVSTNKDIFPVKVTMISRSEIEYRISACALGFNTHIPDKDFIVRVRDNGANVSVYEGGKYTPFKWYEGYDKKYGSKEAELKDTFSKSRINIFTMGKLFNKWKEAFKR